MALWLQRFTIPFRNQSCWFATSNASWPSILALLVPRHISLGEFDSWWVTQEVPKPPRPPHSPHRCWDTQDVYQTGRGNCRNTSKGAGRRFETCRLPGLAVCFGRCFFFLLTYTAGRSHSSDIVVMCCREKTAVGVIRLFQLFRHCNFPLRFG